MFTALKVLTVAVCAFGIVMSALFVVAPVPLLAKAAFVLAGGGCVKGIGDVTGFNG